MVRSHNVTLSSDVVFFMAVGDFFGLIFIFVLIFWVIDNVRTLRQGVKKMDLYIRRKSSVVLPNKSRCVSCFTCCYGRNCFSKPATDETTYNEDLETGSSASIEDKSVDDSENSEGAVVSTCEERYNNQERRESKMKKSVSFKGSAMLQAQRQQRLPASPPPKRVIREVLGARIQDESDSEDSSDDSDQAITFTIKPMSELSGELNLHVRRTSWNPSEVSAEDPQRREIDV